MIGIVVMPTSQGEIMRKNPDRCLNCPSYHSWRDKPNGFTQAMLGYDKNSELLKKANIICPGLSVSLDSKVSGNHLKFSGDTVTIPVGKIALHCEFFEASYGDRMVS